MIGSHERRVWIAQCLCPQRHCVAALAGEADDAAEAERTIGAPLRAKIDEFVGAGVNPWCGICHALQATWRVKLGRTRFRTMVEAAGPLAELQAAQAVTNLIFGTHGPKPPGKPN